jgi:hypothetical protein
MLIYPATSIVAQSHPNQFTQSLCQERESPFPPDASDSSCGKRWCFSSSYDLPAAASQPKQVGLKMLSRFYW